MKSLVIANWKMCPETAAEAKKLFDATRKTADTAKNVTLVIAPPAIFLRELALGYRGKKIAFALQNAHWEKRGAFTGDTSLPQGKEAHASYVIIGHSERREAGETNEQTQKKVSAVLAAKMIPVLCIGEKTRGAGAEHFDFLREELKIGFKDVAPNQANKIIVAYEPIWEIGRETTMAPRDIHEMTIFIHKVLSETLGPNALSVKIVYGGAVNEDNAQGILHDGNVQGLLVGHVSVDSVRFTELLTAVNRL
jgi:triosephosphate isomerase